jgi:hypothetical protein
MQISSSFNKTKVGGDLRVRGVFASGNVVLGGSVGSADIVFLDSPPLAGWASSASVSFLAFGSARVTSVTRTQMAIF